MNAPAPAPPRAEPRVDGPQALYFDGRSARAHAVQLGMRDGCLLAWRVNLAAPLDDAFDAAFHAAFDPAFDPTTARRWPLAQVQWP